MTERFEKQMSFIIEVDRLKSIIRQSYLADGSRRENDSEHSWHLALMAFVLCEHAKNEIDVLKVIKMVLIHDIVEIDAGDTYAYDEKGNEDKYMREVQAAERIFSLLPEDQAQEMRGLWEEFEVRETNEAKFAAALDRVQPIILNYMSEGKAWIDHGISRGQVEKRNEHTKEGSMALWDYVVEIMDKAVKSGYLTS
ncbi:MAG: hydrolase [Firmicutes bacterium HGW-Firmicutes-7]|nr:MAG: hydrolase [Firmicutes bacterium HGW-Firmicutes-7]